ncbi:unnamed protein product [Coffea canephora]|uniref:DH200=94 genomic scaffold, scaffold_746 n=1 Tax=Coffea canephora TaxID=49390 RepID=A0A068VH07_COFCA|nr:unnamed protein product [Coffea canephora]
MEKKAKRVQKSVILVSLKIPHQVVEIVSGSLNDAAAKKYDLEAWFLAFSTYREPYHLSLQGNDQGKQFVHLVNSKLTATQRTMCCILLMWHVPHRFLWKEFQFLYPTSKNSKGNLSFETYKYMSLVVKIGAPLKRALYGLLVSWII